MCARVTKDGVQRSAGPTSGAHDGDDTFQAGGRQGRSVLLKKQERGALGRRDQSAKFKGDDLGLEVRWSCRPCSGGR